MIIEHDSDMVLILDSLCHITQWLPTLSSFSNTFTLTTTIPRFVFHTRSLDPFPYASLLLVAPWLMTPKPGQENIGACNYRTRTDTLPSYCEKNVPGKLVQTGARGVKWSGFISSQKKSRL